MPNRFTDAAIKAREATNKQLADELSAISSLNREKIQELLPQKKDKEAFLKLMEQVEADTAMDEKIAFLQANIASVGS
ncbi:MAG: hypothetical protein ACXWCA_06450, partial [Kaistella sp.]